jgi:hypothetical protein
MMTLSDVAGYVASSMVLLTFLTKDMRLLRVLAIFSNIAFVTYGLLVWLPPVFCLHLLLLPVNALRLREILTTQSSQPPIARLRPSDGRPEARGFATGVASHGIATARAFSESEVTGSFAGPGMVLSAILTALVVPPTVRLLGLSRAKPSHPCESLDSAGRCPSRLPRNQTRGTRVLIGRVPDAGRARARHISKRQGRFSPPPTSTMLPLVLKI